jgi:hypothetical protein
MQGENETDTVARHRKISVIMFAVLVASVLAAWGLTQGTGRLTRNGSKIIAALQEKGAEAIWQDSREHWTITRVKGSPAIWSYYAHRREGEKYHGIEVVITDIKRPLRGHWATWQLDTHLNSYVYHAGSIQLTGRGITLATNTTTTFKDGSIHLKQRVKDGWRASQAGAGDNYLRQGAWPLVRAMVARKETDAKFELILDDTPPKQGVIQFHRLVLRYQGQPDEYPDGYALAWRRSGGKPRAGVSVIDRSGFILLKRNGDFVERAVSRQEVLNTFPRSDAVLRAVLQQVPEHWPQPQAPIDPNEPPDDVVDPTG